MITPQFGGDRKDFISPLCSSTALAPPFSTNDIALSMSTSPSMAPSLTPWSIGTMTALPDSKILFILIVLPSMIHTPWPTLTLTKHTNDVCDGKRQRTSLQIKPETKAIAKRRRIVVQPVAPGLL
jgi:hypothetical protein